MIRFDKNVQSHIKKLRKQMTKFFSLPFDEKAKFAANRQVVDSACYSHVEFLKEYFQLRAAGTGFNGLRFPSRKFAQTSLQVYKDFDLISRTTLWDLLQHIKVPRAEMDKMLDPLQRDESSELARVEFSEESTTCDIVPPRYVSSCNLDIFHYFNDKDTETKWKMNHYSHTDSGILSLIPCSNEPALDFFDMSLQQWLPLERVIHEQASEGNFGEFGIFMVADSIQLLSKGSVRSGLHRVTRGPRPRDSIVFKQRGRPSCPFFRRAVFSAGSGFLLTFVLDFGPRYEVDYKIVGTPLFLRTTPTRPTM